MAARKRNVNQNSKHGKRGTPPPVKSTESPATTWTIYWMIIATVCLAIAFTSFLILLNVININSIPGWRSVVSSTNVSSSSPSGGDHSDPSSHDTENEKIKKQEAPESSPINAKVVSKNKATSKKSSKENGIQYKYANLTNSADNKIRQNLDEADALRNSGKLAEALVRYAVILAKHPKSPRGAYGRARTVDLMAEKERSNQRLEESIEEYLKIFDLPDVPKALLVEAATHCSDRQTFRGWGGKAAKTILRLTQAFPEDLSLLNQLGVKFLMAGLTEDARKAFRRVLDGDPHDGFALVHMGFIVKTVDHDYTAAIPLLHDGIDSGQEGVIDGRFFFHLGDALHRVGKPDEALEVYQLGADHGLFRSKWQRSLYNVDHLAARPWWTHHQTGSASLFKMLEENWQVIRDEGLANLDPKTGSFVDEDEDLREKGDWKQFSLYSRGRKDTKRCQKAPKTCAIIDRFAEAAMCKRGQVKFSVMHPGVHVWPHCGPTNCRLRAHLGLVVPDDQIRIRVVDQTKPWTEGKVFIFDDSFEHEVWHESDKLRMVLIVDIWHPDLTMQERASLSPI